MIDGEILKERFFLRNNCREALFRTEDLTLGDFFRQDFTQLSSFKAKDLPLFAFNKDPTRFVRKSHDCYMFQPLDFSRPVHVVVSELDRVKLPPSVPMSREEWEEFTQRPLAEILRLIEGERFWERHFYSLDILERMKADERVLFAYVSTSGVGVRFALYTDRPLSEGTYRSTCEHYTQLLWREYDREGLLQPDPSCYSGELYWFYPVWPHVWVNERCIEVSVI